MATASNDLLELVLRECAAAGDQPWYPSEYVRATGMARADLDAALDQLRLAGLLSLTEWVQGQGQGYRLTEAGRDVLHSNRQLNRLRQHGITEHDLQRVQTKRPAEIENRPASWDRTRAVQDALMSRRRPTVTLVLLSLNIVYFFIGMALALQMHFSISDYLGLESLFANTEAVYNRMGSLRLDYVLGEGQWWRLLTCAFIHAGLLHLGMNMFFLYSLGPLLESMWGHGRFLAMYLISAIGASVAALIFRPEAGMVGASGALCGMLGSMLAWVILNRAHLPPALYSRWMSSLLVNIVIIVIISSSSRISAEGHYGGGITGLVVSIPLMFTRFGRGLQVPLGWLGTLAVPVFLLGWLYQTYAPDIAEMQAQVQARRAVREIQSEYGPQMRRARATAERTNKEFVDWINQVIQQKVDPDRSQKALTDKAAEASRAIKAVQERLQQADRAEDPRVQQGIQAAQTYFQRWTEYYEQVQHVLKRRNQLGQNDLNQLEARHNRRIAAWDKLRDSVLGPVFQE